MAETKIEDFQWMKGSWSCPKDGGTFEETWLDPKAGMMIGCGRHVIDGKVAFVEYLAIQPDEKGALAMFVHLGSLAKQRKIYSFGLSSSEGASYTFELPEKDFPHTITYTHITDGTERMYVVLAGAKEGKPMKDVYDFTRLKD